MALTYRTMLLHQVGSAVAALLIVWLVFASIYLLTEQPNLFSLLLLALLADLLESFRLGRHNASRLWILPPLFVVWDFLHGSVYGLSCSAPVLWACQRPSWQGYSGSGGP